MWRVPTQINFSTNGNFLTHVPGKWRGGCGFSYFLSNEVILQISFSICVPHPPQLLALLTSVCWPHSFLQKDTYWAMLGHLFCFRSINIVKRMRYSCLVGFGSLVHLCGLGVWVYLIISPGEQVGGKEDTFLKGNRDDIQTKTIGSVNHMVA